MHPKPSIPTSSRLPCLLLFGILLVSLPVSAAEPRVARFDQADLAETAREVEMDGAFRVESIPLGLAKSGSTLELQRVRVFTEDAQIVVHGEGGQHLMPLPKNVYFRGSIAGKPRSRVTLSVREHGEVRGIIAAENRHWLLMTDTVGKNFGPLMAHEVDPTTGASEKASSFSCATDELTGEFSGVPQDDPTGSPLNVIDFADSPLTTALTPDPTPNLAALAAASRTSVDKGLLPSFTARVAIETDYEYFLKFSNLTDAIDYVTDVFCFMSGIYADEVDTSILVSSVSLWTTAADPWTETNSSCALYQFGKYWNDNRGGVSRTIAHLFSGKSSNSGVAWVGVLCRSGSTQTVSVGNCNTLTNPTSNYVGGYGFTGGIDGNFNPDNPSVLWDIAGTSHEIGHNFNSPHTHCWAGQAGGVTNIDECYGSQSGCYAGPASLPSGCPGSGNGCGTIMSYCQLRGGGFSNVSLTLGEGHPYGDNPGRVPTRMNLHVLSKAVTGCLDYTVKNGIFADDFESGNTIEWSSTVTD